MLKPYRITNSFMCFLPHVSVAGVGERLPKASIAAHFRRKGCVGDAALRGSDQGEPFFYGSPLKGI
jgi:hypothetical protein